MINEHKEKNGNKVVNSNVSQRKEKEKKKCANRIITKEITKMKKQNYFQNLLYIFDVEIKMRWNEWKIRR